MSKATSKIRPLSDRVVVTAREQETTTPGGIVIPDSVTDRETSIQGVVIAVGNGKYVEGKIQPLQVKVGDKVLFGKYAGTNVKLDATEYLVMREEDIMGVLE